MGDDHLFDVIVIGCGVVGAATAFELSKYKLDVLVLEAENDLAMGTTKANSAIIHAGYDPVPGTLMARLNVRGNELTGELCEKLQVPFERVGSLVLAFSGEEEAHIKKLYDRGLENGVPDMRLLSAREVREMEPAVAENVVGALYAPTAGIIDPWDYTLALAETAVRNGARICFDSRVVKIEKTPEGFRVLTANGGEFEAKYIFNAAGIEGDRVHELVCGEEFTIIPVRGQYFLLDKSQGGIAGHVLFQCPTAVGKGVLIAPTIHGNLLVGPDAEPIADKENRATTSGGLDDVRRASQKTSAAVNFRENIRNFAGLRAFTEEDDFIIRECSVHGFFDLAGIKSPGLSAAPAIAEEAVELLRAAGAQLLPRETFIDERKKIRFAHLSQEEKAELIKKDPRYGRVICRCETVTEGEIVRAMESPIPPRSIAGVKRRCGAGMGRCQGGFCSPRVGQIIAEELGISRLEVSEDGEGSFILTGRTKGEGGDGNV